MRTIAQLQRQIVACRRCPRLVQHCRRTAQEKVKRYRDWDYWGKPVPSLGERSARLYVVGLAPAAHGGNRTGRVFTGDRSGDWVFGALHAYGFASQPTSTHIDDGLRLQDAYITAAVHCAPPDNKPSREEFEACQPYLLREIQLLKQVRVVVGLGQLAFSAYLKARREVGLRVPTPRPKFGHGKRYDLPALSRRGWRQPHRFLPSQPTEYLYRSADAAYVSLCLPRGAGDPFMRRAATIYTRESASVAGSFTACTKTSEVVRSPVCNFP